MGPSPPVHLVHGVRTRMERTARLAVRGESQPHRPEAHRAVRGVQSPFPGLSGQLGKAEALRGENCAHELAPEPAARGDAPSRGRGAGLPSARREGDGAGGEAAQPRRGGFALAELRKRWWA